MATINGKALVKDGKPLDRVYSNGQLVYGRNLLYGTRDFSGTWVNVNGWITDGTYKGLTVKKRTAQWGGVYKTFTAPKDADYTFSAYVKGSGSTASIYRQVNINGGVNGSVVPNKLIGNTFDWLRDSFKVTLKAGDIIYAKYEISSTATDSILWTSGHKWGKGSTATWSPAPEDYI